VSAALRVSFDRLNDLQKRVFTHLSVFTIPFEYPAAEALFPDEKDFDKAVDVLVQRALLTFDGRRHAYHALVRQFAYEELQEMEDDWRQVHRRAAEYLEAKAKDGKITPAEALEERDQWERAEEWDTFARRALALVGSLGRQGYWSEIEQRLARALEIVRIHLDDVGLEAHLLRNTGILADQQAEWDRAIELLEEGERCYAAVGDEKGQAGVWDNLAAVYRKKGKLDRAIEMHQQGLQISERTGDVRGMARTWMGLSLVYDRQGRWDQAIEMCQRSLEVFEQIEDALGVAKALNNLGLAYADKGEWGLAIGMYQRALENYGRADIEDPHGMAQTFNNLGNVCCYRPHCLNGSRPD